MEKLVINIGRQFGSGGKDIAALVAERLSFPLYDDALIRQAAIESGFDESMFLNADEKRGLFSFSSVFGGIGREQIFTIQSNTIQNIADRESAVIVGRCANYVLRDRDYTLDVFIMAPLEKRVERIMKKHQMDEESARSWIEKEDKQRAQYYDFFTFSQWGQASDYDFCIDSSLFGYEQTAEIIVELAKRKLGL